MDIYIIIGIVAAFLSWLVMSSVRLRVLFDEPTRRIELSYTVIRFRVDLKDLYGKIYLFGIRLFKFNLRELRKKRKKVSKTAKPKIKEKEEKTRRKGITGFDWSLINASNLGILRRFVGKIRINYLHIEIRGGFDDPYRTGQAVASYWAFKGMFRRIMSHVHFYPDFDAERLEFKGKSVVSIRAFYILVLIIRLLMVFIKLKMTNKDSSKKKELAYV